MLANLIQQHASAAANAKQWAAVSAALTAASITLDGVRVSGKETILGLIAQGRDADAVRLVLEASPSGRGLLDLLPAVGVNWVDPLTLAVLAKNQGDGKLSAADVDALKSLSSRKTSPAARSGMSEADCSAAECEAAWKLQLLQLRREAFQERFDAIKNQIGTTEQPLAVAALRTMANELELV